MCDYSLENQISRAAEVGDKLVTSSFPMPPTRGFCAENEAGVAVCLLPGTELAFAEPVRYNGLWGMMVNYVKSSLRHDMADAKLSLLHEGQRARVLQLPAQGEPAYRHAHVHVARRHDALTPAP